MWTSSTPCAGRGESYSDVIMRLAVVEYDDARASAASETAPAK